MRIKNNKKGFTLTELIVVIVIIGILAAVLIPQLTNYISKAKLNNDISDVSNMNTIITTDNYLDTIDNVNEVKDTLEEKGFGSEFLPKVSSYHYYWCIDYNTVYLIEDNNDLFNVYYPDTNKTSVTKDNTYRLDYEYSILSCNIEGVTLSRNALVKDTETTIKINNLTGTNNKTVMINSVVYNLNSNNEIILTINTNTTISYDTNIYLTYLAVDPTSISLHLGETTTLTPVYTPSDATNKNVTWRSSDETVVEVDSTGKVTAIELGQTTITATSEDGNFAGECIVKVTQHNIGYKKVTSQAQLDEGISNGAKFIILSTSGKSCNVLASDVQFGKESTSITSVYNEDGTIMTLGLQEFIIEKDSVNNVYSFNYSGYTTYMYTTSSAAAGFGRDTLSVIQNKSYYSTFTFDFLSTGNVKIISSNGKYLIYRDTEGDFYRNSSDDGIGLQLYMLTSDIITYDSINYSYCSHCGHYYDIDGKILTNVFVKTNSVKDGDTIMLVGGDRSVAYCSTNAGTYSFTNNLDSLTGFAQYSSNNVIVLNNPECRFTIEDAGDGYFYIKNKDNEYIYAVKSASDLKGVANITASYTNTTRWQFNQVDSVFTITSAVDNFHIVCTSQYNIKRQESTTTTPLYIYKLID